MAHPLNAFLSLSTGIVFTDPETGEHIPLIQFHEDEATAEEAAGPDGGRMASGVVPVQFVSPGKPGQELTAPGPSDHGRVLASLIGEDGPWTDITVGSLDCDQPRGTLIPFWLTYKTLYWGTLDIPKDIYSLRVVSRGPAAWGI